MLVPKQRRGTLRQSGFSLLESLIVIVIISVLVSMQIPQALSMVHIFRLNNATSQFGGLAQSTRSFAVRDSSPYSVYFVRNVPITEAFIGIKGSMFDDVKDPLTSWSAEVAPQPATSAPSTLALETAAFLSTSGVSTSAITVIDGFVVSSSGVTFSQMGTPCAPVTHGSATVCNSSTSSTAVAYWTFFQNSASGAWQAVTISPAGRVQRWSYSGTWKLL